MEEGKVCLLDRILGICFFICVTAVVGGCTVRCCYQEFAQTKAYIERHENGEEKINQEKEYF